jgi:hypothetical protein
MKNDAGANVITGLFILGLTIAGAIGWVMNIVAIAGSNFNDINGLLVLRIVGIFFGPLGAVLGWV